MHSRSYEILLQYSTKTFLNIKQCQPKVEIYRIRSNANNTSFSCKFLVELYADRHSKETLVIANLVFIIIIIV